jgi:hypothetical protein
MKYPKRSQYKYAKSRYRIGNWSEYEAGLRRRGDLTVWLSEETRFVRMNRATRYPGREVLNNH